MLSFLFIIFIIPEYELIRVLINSFKSDTVKNIKKII